MSINFSLHCKLLTDTAIVLGINGSWFDETLDILTKKLIVQYPQLTIREKIVGADRHAISLCWQGHYFQFNIEYYSESIWFEVEDQQSEDQLEPLYLYLKSQDDTADQKAPV